MDADRLARAQAQLEQLKNDEHTAWNAVHGGLTNILHFGTQTPIGLYSEERVHWEQSTPMAAD